MRYLTTLLCCVLLAGNAKAKNKWGRLSDKIIALDQALLQRDTVAIGKLVHQHITYGHSNGWIERRNTMTSNLYDGTLFYKEIRNIVKPEIAIYDKTGIARLQIGVVVVVEGKELTFKLKVLQTWIWTKNDWKLLARQSVKID